MEKRDEQIVQLQERINETNLEQEEGGDIEGG